MKFKAMLEAAHDPRDPTPFEEAILGFACGWFVLFAFLTQSAAASVSDALSAFGLIGSWSRNCAQNPNDLGARVENGIAPTRWSFMSSYVSNPTLVITQRPPTGLITTRFEINSAVQVTADKIKYGQILLSSKVGTAAENANPHPQLLTTVAQKMNDKMTITSQIGEDGTVYAENGFLVVRQPKNGQMVEVNRVPYGIFERCID
jgi:hypothetical protein